ncbi:MAG: hypothetical protein HN350_14805 [Phycisphaerales bacterium]|jgi:hypothetical protein|nr:hypothetical protein [Phycisphaerales bacterium]
MGSVHNPQGVTIAAVELSDVLAVEWRERRREIITPPGDGELHNSAAEYDAAVVSGRLLFADPAQAAAAAGLFGTLVASLQGVGGGADQTLTITNVRTGGAENLTGHNRAAKCSVSFVASGAGAVSLVESGGE